MLFFYISIWIRENTKKYKQTNNQITENNFVMTDWRTAHKITDQSMYYIF